MPIPTSPVTAPASLHLQTRHTTPHTVVVTVTGEIDLATAPDLHTALLKALIAHRPTVINVDLTTCTFLDCSGLRVLLAAHTTAQTTGCQIWIKHPQPFVRLILEVTKLLEMFTTDDDMARQTTPRHDPATTASGTPTEQEKAKEKQKTSSLLAAA
ncbi:STAS domain-containing protein [Allorhizocola rhizosphaerae]|uniref:STAS domain-containing protein n=1 Tax=Allorhizocola rhizosphaerae TaxID=1872709 RepID=UPI000E3E6A79|nr:STAS domain-containing protein [Allorhizocola rhizosphaerae]